MDEEKIVLDKDTFRALAVDSRVSILRLLLERKFTASEIASELGMSNSTIKEHLDVLAGANLIRQDSEKRKWKYYSLTWKGKRFIQPKEIKVLVTFCLSTLGAIASAAMFIRDYLQSAGAEIMDSAMIMAPKAAESARMVTANGAGSAVPMLQAAEQEILVESTGVHHIPGLYWGMAAIALMIIAAFLLGMYVNKTTVVRVRKDGQ